MDNLVANILQEHALRSTDCRYNVLQLFYNSKSALAQSDLDKNIGEKYDRVTLYRTLKTFLKKGIIHQVLDPEGSTKYALCKKDSCSETDHNHDHIHFKCVVCSETLCIDSVNIPTISLPKGYISHEVNFLVQGKCPNC